MAKVGFWLRGARGKMGGAVLMKSENGTVARENVTPKNPRTDKQMYQRAIFATVATAAKAMKELINHSFYGIADGTKCIQQFRKLNLAKLRNKVAADIAGTLTPSDRIAMLAPKNFKFIVPNEYQISSGTLPSPNIQVLGSMRIGFPAFNVTSPITVKEFVYKLFGVNPGEQITLAAITVNEDVLIYQTPGHEDEPGYCCKESMFTAKRLVFNGEEIEEWNSTIPLADLSDLDYSALMSYIEGVLEETKSDMSLLDTILSLTERTATTSQDEITNVQVKAKEAGILMAGMKAGAFVRSKFENGQWNYSTAMMSLMEADEDFNYGVVPEVAVASYTEGTSLGTSNDPFLDEGGNGGSI